VAELAEEKIRTGSRLCSSRDRKPDGRTDIGSGKRNFPRGRFNFPRGR
jgi:hypothetical protein